MGFAARMFFSGFRRPPISGLLFFDPHVMIFRDLRLVPVMPRPVLKNSIFLWNISPAWTSHDNIMTDGSVGCIIDKLKQQK